MILQHWLEEFKKANFIPEPLERYFVAKARASIHPDRQKTSTGRRTLWVDISVLSRHDAGTGIQRVVRSLFGELRLTTIQGWNIQPVVATPRQSYRAVPWDIPTLDLEKCPVVEPGTGDIFFGLDLSSHIIPRHMSKIMDWKNRGVRVYFVVYDILPLQYSNWFSSKVVRAFRRWVRSLAILADGVFCISAPVRDDFELLMRRKFGLTTDTISTYLLPMGGDIKSSLPSQGFPLGFHETLKKLAQEKFVLMVGTIEPRKGYAQILDAFEHIWEQGALYRLVIVGRPGWLTNVLQQRILCNRYLNRQLFWFDDASDEALEALYQNCGGVIVASYAEGFGLPLLEAIGHGKHVLARDIPVFRQFRTDLLSYFPNDSTAENVAGVIDGWLKEISKSVPGNSARPAASLPTWRASLHSLLEQLLPKNALINVCSGEVV